MIHARLLFAPLLLTAIGAAVAADQPQQQPPAAHTDTHQSLAKELVGLLSQTEIALNSCNDQSSVQAAFPRLLELSEQAATLKQRQKALPEPTVQDYLAAQELVGDFNTLAQAIEQHIDRLKKANLLSPELKKLLGLPLSD